MYQWSRTYLKNRAEEVIDLSTREWIDLKESIRTDYREALHAQFNLERFCPKEHARRCFAHLVS